ncbi:MAG: polyprenyl diphosphate synthase [Patescibacteria group bacterium]
MKNIPQHLGIILDGNRRWAKEKGLPTLAGHRRGQKVVEDIIKLCAERGIKILTLFVFSTENWKRSQKEVKYLMKLLSSALDKKNIQKFHKDDLKIKVIGETEMFSSDLKKKITEAEELTENNKSMTVNMALSYGGRAELTHAIKNIIEKKIPAEKITEEVISENLWTSDVDFIIRTGKAQRISNFLIWQAAYSELYFSNKYWPDFTERDLDDALADYANRQRRFGK